MALYNPDLDYIKGEELIKKLQGDEGKYIRYLVEKDREYAKSLQKKIKEMQGVFDGIRKFTNY